MRKTMIWGAAVICTVPLCLSAGGIAMAQSAPAPARGAQSETSAQAEDARPVQVGVQDIIVTATRRAANLQSVPATVSAFQEGTLKAFGIKSAVEIGQLVPGLVVTRTGISSNLFLRGVGASSAGYSTEPPIATYIDGFYMPTSGSAASNFNNVERIEVLKGPQGTLYGRNSTGGLINIITRDPASVVKLDASASYGNYDTVALNFYGSAPLTDMLGVNLAVTHTNQRDGWGRNLLLDTDIQDYRNTGVQAKIVWEPQSGTRISLRGMYDRLSTDQGVVGPIFPGSIGVDGTQYAGPYNAYLRREVRAYSRVYSTGLKIEHDLGFANFLSLTGYVRARGANDNVPGGVPGKPVTGQTTTDTVISGGSNSFSQEFQLSSPHSSDAPFEWIAGLFYYHDNTFQRADVNPNCYGTVCLPTPTTTVGYPKTRSYAGYGEGTYRLFEKTRITLGLRYTSDDKSLTGAAAPRPGFPNSVTTLPATTILRPGDPYPGNPQGIDTAINFSKLTYKLVLAQDVTDLIHLYASYNRGFKSGTYNPTAFNNEPARPEILDAVEVGVKSDLFDRLLRLNVSAFHYKYKDIQLRTTAPPAPAGTTITYNAGRAAIKGVDAEFNLVPSSHFSVNGSIEYLDASYSSFPAGNCTSPRQPNGTTILGGNVTVPCDLSGRHLINAPKWSYNLGATYTLPTPVGEFSLTANDSYKSRSYFDPDNRLSQAGYHIVNAALTWTDHDKRFDVQLYGRNLFDNFYFAQVVESNSDVYISGAPRTYGVKVGYHL